MFCRRWVLTALALAAFRPGWCGELVAQQNPAKQNPGQQNPAQQNSASTSSSQAPTPAPQPQWIDIQLHPAGETPAAAAAPAKPAAPRLPEIKFPNFASCPVAEIQIAVPELAHLKAAQDQSQLAALLDKVGAKTVEIARKTPNLVSHEQVVSQQNGFTVRTNYSFLMLPHDVGKNGLTFDEYRVDVATGEKLQTDFVEKAAESAATLSPVPELLPVPHNSPEPELPKPTSQGFVSAWLYFHPTMQNELKFRYLGQEKMNGHETQVVAFAQKPGSVELPAVYGYEGQTYKIFLQGVAWIDPANFRIERLRTDLLSVPTGLPLHQLSVDIQFAQISIVEVPSPQWLPTQVVVTTNLNGATARESHTYTNYRLFRTRSRILLK